MNKRKALIYSLAKFTALFTAAVFLLTTPALLILQGGDSLLPAEAVLTSTLSAGFFFWSIKTAWRITKIE